MVGNKNGIDPSKVNDCATLIIKMQSDYYRLVEGFRVTGLFAGQYNTEDYGTITGVIYSLEEQQFAPPTYSLYNTQL